MEQAKKERLQKVANQIRRNVVTAVYSAGAGHPGGSLGISDVMAYLYFAKMNVDPKNPKNPDRDRFVMSKGHCAPVLYGALAEKGFFPREDIKGFRSIDSYLEGHPDMKKVPGCDMSTGSLGQGICAANGMALVGKLSGKNYRVYAVLGDGELEEGQVWEAAMFAPHYKLDNMTAVIDYNGLQIDGDITKVMNPTPIDKKFEAFGWNVITCDGNDFDSIEKAFEQASAYKGKPSAIIAKTIKGKGVSYMENVAGWHGKAPNDEEYKIAMKDLGVE